MKCDKYMIFLVVVFFSNILFAIEQKEKKLIEKVVATVSSDPILLSELQAAHNREPGQSKNQILQNLIEDKALEKHCVSIGILIKDEDVEQYIDNIAKQYGSKSLFKNQLEKTGFKYNEYKKFIKARLYEMRIVQQKIRNQVIEEKNLIQKVPTDEEHSLVIEQIIYKSNKKDLASDFSKQINAGSEFIPLVAEYAKKDKTILVSHLGVVERSEIENSFAESIFNTNIKNATLPIQSKQGWHVFYIKEKSKKKINMEATRKEQYELEIKQALERYRKDILSSFNIEKFL
jgi:parvulin-like peptidyl-prolyl isomerase